VGSVAFGEHRCHLLDEPAPYHLLRTASNALV